MICLPIMVHGMLVKGRSANKRKCFQCFQCSLRYPKMIMSVFPIFSVQVVFEFVNVGKTLVEMLYGYVTSHYT